MPRGVLSIIDEEVIMTTTVLRCPPSVPDLAAVKARQQATWASGDYSIIGATLQIVAESLCEAIELRAGERVLDVAAGTGNAAIAAARRWCEVVATDYVPALLERGRERAVAEGLTVDFREGDAESLPLPDGSFDVVLSTFGGMFAPDHSRTAGELLRVCRPGGRIGLANWTPDGFIGQLFKTVGRYVPPPPGLQSPALWGSEAWLRELFGDQIAAFKATRKHFVFRYRSAQHWLETFRTYYGPVLKAFAALPADQQDALAADLIAFAQRASKSADTFAAPSEYLEVVLTRR
jgi:ubiquinone/menaquinone biosynthesis C-methylase UbiE